MRQDTGKALSVVSDRYTVVEHRNVLTVVRNAFQHLDVGPTPSGIFVDRGGARMRALFKFPALAQRLNHEYVVDTLCPCINGFGSKPRSTSSTFIKLRSSRPEPTSSMQASATSETTSTVRSRSCFRLCPRPSRILKRHKQLPPAMRSPGMRPKNTAATTAISTVHPSAARRCAACSRAAAQSEPCCANHASMSTGQHQPQNGSGAREHQLSVSNCARCARGCAQGPAHRELLCPCGCPRQQQVRKIHAGDQQNHAHRTPQHKQRAVQPAAYISFSGTGTT